MTIYIFCGPTLPPQEITRLGMQALPPAARGDVLQLTSLRPAAIGIIDGHFGGAPAVWHKEILWALKQDIPVFGAAGLGALRAAELSAFGMRGIGEIFHSFHAGRLLDDDEIAVAHAGPEEQWRPCSEAMVNIRSALSCAVAEAVIPAQLAESLTALAKNIFYMDRSWGNVLAAGRASGLPQAQLDTLRSWLPQGRVDQTRIDALQMLSAIRDSLEATPNGSSTPHFDFEQTVYWDHLLRHETPQSTESLSSDALALNHILDELRLTGPGYAAAFRGVLLRHLLLQEADRRNIKSSPAAIDAKVIEFRRARHLETDEDYARWMRDNALTEAQAARLFDEEARIDATATKLGNQVTARFVDYLRLTSDFGGLLRRARLKHEMPAAARRGNRPRSSGEV